MKRRDFFAAICVVCTVALAAALFVSCLPMPDIPLFDPERGVDAARRGGISFTVASYNVWSGGNTLENEYAIAAQLDDYGVDIAGLQEVDTDDFDRRGGGFTTALTSGSLANKHFTPTETYAMGDKYGIMTTTSRAIADAQYAMLPYPYSYVSAQMEPRMVQRTLVDVDGVRIAFYNTHLDYTGTQVDGRLLRELQVEFIFELMQSDPSPYKVLTGDLNISSFDDLAPFFDSDDYALFINPDNALATFSGDSSFRSIDNIIYTCKTLELTGGEVVETDLSDHYMVTASFETLA